MKKLIGLIAAFTLFLLCLSSLNFMNVAFAESESDLIFSAESNSIWVLNTSTKKLIFVQFEEPDKVWKSNQITVPIDFNLDKCVLKAVGARGTSVFLFDKSSGMTTLYKVKNDHSVAAFQNVNIGVDLK
jgi:hypothetical protein